MKKPRDKYTDKRWQERQAAEIGARVAGIEDDILSLMVKRLLSISPKSSPVRMRSQIAQDMGRIQSMLIDGSAHLDDFTLELFEEMAAGNDAWAASFYAAQGVQQLSFKENQFLKHILRMGEARALNEVANIFDTSVMYIQTTGGYVPMEFAYREIVMKHAYDMAGGFVSSDKAIKAALREAQKIAGGGIRVKYASGVTRDLYSAVSMNVMDNFRVTVQELRNRQAEEYGANGVEISAHGLCAPDHVAYQGHEYSLKEFKDIEDGLQRPIGAGYNCRHTVSKILLGLFEPTYTPQELRELRQNSERMVKFTRLNGDEDSMSAYEFSQLQRNMETQIRKTRQAAQIARNSGNEEMAAKARKLSSRADYLLKNYNRMSREAGISTEPYRYRVYGR